MQIRLAQCKLGYNACIMQLIIQKKNLPTCFQHNTHAQKYREKMMLRHASNILDHQKTKQS